MGTRLDPRLTAVTTVGLSHSNNTWRPESCFAKAMAASTTGTISFGAMGMSRQVEGHWSWIHELSSTAPHPQEPDASDLTAMEGRSRPVAASNPCPFHWEINLAHQAISDLASQLSLVKWWSSLTVVDRSIKRLN